jgi:hypothetical protein
MKQYRCFSPCIPKASRFYGILVCSLHRHISLLWLHGTNRHANSTWCTASGFCNRCCKFSLFKCPCRALKQQQHKSHSTLDALRFTAGRLHLSKPNASMFSWNSSGCLNLSYVAWYSLRPDVYVPHQSLLAQGHEAAPTQLNSQLICLIGSSAASFTVQRHCKLKSMRPLFYILVVSSFHVLLLRK